MAALFQDPYTLAFCVATFLVAGTIKGVLGIGLPATAIALLTLVMDPTEAIPVMVLPIIATNIQQFFFTPHRAETARAYGWIAVALVVSIFVTALFITRMSQSFLVIAIGVVMCVFAVHALSGFRIPVGRGPMWQIGVGLTAGVCGGLSAIWAPPIAMYLLSLNVSRDRFVSGCGFLFLVGSVPLAAGLTASGVLNSRTMALSMVALVVSIIAFRLGAALRSRLANDTFRKAVLIAFLVFGARLIVTGVTR